jgi:hypothetical protein
VKEKLDTGKFDVELNGYVKMLEGYQHLVPALCGSAWTTWSAPGACQVCKTSVNCAEKGLHCKNGGHRICWTCMVEKIDW